MKIMCLHPHLSMRAVKEMAALKKLGHEITLVYEGIGCSVERGFGQFWDQIIRLPNYTFKGEFYYRRLIPNTYKKIINNIIKVKDFDIIHAFSMPDTLAIAAIRYLKIPLVFDTRDIHSGMDVLLLEDFKNKILNKIQSSIYRKIVRKFEREANEKSSGRIYVSDEMLHYLSSAYNIDLSRSVVLPNYQSNSFIPAKQAKKLSDKDNCKHLALIGNIIYDELNKVVSAIKKISAHRINIHIYPVGNKIKIDNIKAKCKSDPYIHFHSALPPNILIEELQQYDFGLLPFPADRNAINIRTALPNRMFDYLIAGLPVAANNSGSISKFVKANNIGFVYNNIDELVLKLKVDSNNYKIDKTKFIMENHIHLVERLYKQIKSL